METIRTWIEPVALYAIVALPWPSLVIPHSASPRTPKAIPSHGELETNYAGAAIFIAYIVAALILTGLITHSLYSMYKRARSKNQLSTEHMSTMKTFVGLTLISFGVLSYNMLSFLIVSYLDWRNVHPVSLPGFGVHAFAKSIWQWMTTSTLFLDFAQDLCNTEKSHVWPWSETALVATLLSFFYMSAAGQQMKTPHLLRYFLIGQILPISFAQNLFFLAALLEGRGTQSARHSKTVKRQKAPPKFRLPSTIWTWVVVIAYRVLLAILPGQSSSSYFIGLVLLTRLILFSPLLLTFQSEAFADAFFKRVALAYAVTVMAAPNMLYNIPELLYPTKPDFAVSALGVDAAIWTLSMLLWSVLSRRLR